MIEVDLYYYEGMGVIYREKTGVIYTTQTGGSWCNHPTVEGYFVPLNLRYDFDTNSFHDEVCGGTFLLSDITPNSEVISKIDDSLGIYEIFVDTKALDELQEAWIPVVDSKGRRGIFVYTNCD